MITTKYYKNKMNTILSRKHLALGFKSDMFRCSRGYLRNYLYPKNICSLTKVGGVFLKYRSDLNNIFFKKKYYYGILLKKLIIFSINKPVLWRIYNTSSLLLKININLPVNLYLNGNDFSSDEIKDFGISISLNYKSLILVFIIKINI
jgi:hypothetical protein